MDLRRLFGRGGRQADDESASPVSGDDELADRAADLSRSLGRMPPDEQRIAAIERLTELRAAGKVSEENFVKEKRRLSREG